MFNALNEVAKHYEYLIKAIGAFLPFLIALFMAYIAYQQWQTNETKRRQDLYDKRLEFYWAMLNKIDEIEKAKFTNKEDISKEEAKLNILIEKYEFLVSKRDSEELTNLILWARGVKLKSKYKKSKYPHFSVELNEYKQLEIENRITEIFEKYLRIEKTFFQAIFPKLCSMANYWRIKSLELDKSERDEIEQYKSNVKNGKPKAETEDVIQ